VRSDVALKGPLFHGDLWALDPGEAIQRAGDPRALDPVAKG
jgi:hypothetical protein